MSENTEDKLPSEIRDATISQEEYERICRFLDAYFASAEAGICPICQTPIERKKQVGRCVYAEPCGCRLWQGFVPPSET